MGRLRTATGLERAVAVGIVTALVVALARILLAGPIWVIPFMGVVASASSYLASRLLGRQFVRTNLLVLYCLVLVAAVDVVWEVGTSHYGVGADTSPVSMPAHEEWPSDRALPGIEAVPDTLETTTVPAPAPTTTAEVIPASRTVLIVGDSLTVNSVPWLPDELRGVHWAATAIDAVHGRKTAQGLAALAAHRGDLPPTVLIALGTNDLEATPTDITGWMQQARGLVGTRRLIWVNLQMAERPQLANYHTINAALAAAAAQYHVELADWAAWSTAMGVEHLGDGIHYPAPGDQQRAHFYAEVLARHS